jgi:hypothetical protein
MAVASCSCATVCSYCAFASAAWACRSRTCASRSRASSSRVGWCGRTVPASFADADEAQRAAAGSAFGACEVGV